MKKLLMCSMPVRIVILAILGFGAGYLLGRDQFTLGLPLVALGVVFAVAPLFIKDPE